MLVYEWGVPPDRRRRCPRTEGSDFTVEERRLEGAKRNENFRVKEKLLLSRLTHSRPHPCESTLLPVKYVTGRRGNRVSHNTWGTTRPGLRFESKRRTDHDPYFIYDVSTENHLFIYSFSWLLTYLFNRGGQTTVKTNRRDYIYIPYVLQVLVSILDCLTDGSYVTGTPSPSSWRIFQSVQNRN